MNRKSLLRIIYSILGQKNILGKDRTVFGVIIYYFILGMYASDTGIGNKVRDTIERYYKTLLNGYEDFRNNYIGYGEMIGMASGELVDMNEGELEELYDIYRARELAEEFGEEFKLGMYKVRDAGVNGSRNLRRIHESVMLPIAKYYEETKDVRILNVNIKGSEKQLIPGKVLHFAIKGVSSDLIVNDIISGIINISVYKCYLNGSDVVLVNN